MAANFGVGRIDLVRPVADPNDPEVFKWACGGDRRLRVVCHESLAAAAAPYLTLVATASGRGRDAVPVITPGEAVGLAGARGLESLALVFGNETSGLRRQDLDHCDLTIQVPTEADFPVLNLAQAVAIVLSYLSMEIEQAPPLAPQPAPQAEVAALMDHLEQSLSTIGFLDPDNPQRVLRKLRRLFGRAGITANEVSTLRGICRQMEWAARAEPKKAISRL